MHVHLIISHADYDHLGRVYRDKRCDVIMPISAQELLMVGATTVRDVGAPFEDILVARDRINRDEVAGARVFASGPFPQKVVPPLEVSSCWTVDGPEDSRAKMKN
jgi:hypothetical protein